MPSTKANPRVGAALAAFLLALVGAAGLAPVWTGREGAVILVDVSPSASPPAPLPKGAKSFSDSDLGRALREAPGDGRIRLFTDGVDTGRVLEILPKRPVDVVLRPRRDDMVLLGVSAPQRVPVGRVLSLSVRVGRTQTPAQGARVCALSLSRDGEPVGTPRVLSLEPGQVSDVRFLDRIDAPGVVVYRAEIHSDFGPTEGDRRDFPVRIGVKPRVLVLGEPAWTHPDFAFQGALGSDDQVLASAAKRRLFDAISLRGSLPAAMQRQVVQAVTEGCGLAVWSGAPYRGGLLEPVLPLTERPPQGNAILLALDMSGSMERRKTELLAAVQALRTALGPDDEVAFVAFHSEVVASSKWRTNATASWDLAALRPKGQTKIVPALRASRAMLEQRASKRRRLLVISDGAWHDWILAADALREFGSMERAALFVQRDVDARALLLFPTRVVSASDWARAIVELERDGGTRRVARADAKTAQSPSWLAGAAPPAGVYQNFTRLFPNGDRAAVPLFAPDAALFGAWRAGGKVVVSAVPCDRAAVLHAVARDQTDLTLDVTRRGHTIEIDVLGAGEQPVVIGTRTVVMRRVGPGRRHGRARVGVDDTVVQCGSAIMAIPSAASLEVAGLQADRATAQAMARKTGGRLVTDATQLDEAGAPRPAFWFPLVLAVLMIGLSAVRRRA